MIIDDFFPAKHNRFRYATSRELKEAWVMVLEKAYAKLHHSYAAISGGWVSDGVLDLTGCLASEFIDLTSDKVRIQVADGSLWQMMMRSYEACMVFFIVQIIF